MFNLSCCKTILKDLINSTIFMLIRYNNTTKDYILYMFKTSLVIKDLYMYSKSV